MRFAEAGVTYRNSGTLAEEAVIDAGGVVLINTATGQLPDGIRFASSGGTVVNEAGGEIGVRNADAWYPSTVVTGSSGADTVINAGTIYGTLNLGGGADSFTDRGGSVQGSGRGVNLEDGDDVFRMESSTGPQPFANGGAGVDTVVVATSGGVARGGGFFGFERLVLEVGGNLQSFSGYQSIRLAATSPNGSYNFVQSNNPLVDLALGGQSVQLAGSTIRSITGGDAAETVDLFYSFVFASTPSQVTGTIDLGGGGDRFEVDAFFNETAPIAVGPVNGGTGNDTLSVVFANGGSGAGGSLSLDLGRATGFEVLEVNGRFSYLDVSVALARVTGVTSILVGEETRLSLAASTLSGAELRGAAGGGVVLEADVVIGSYTAFRFDPTAGSTAVADPAMSVSFTNRGLVEGAVVLAGGGDLYDGRTGTAGGLVQGGAGDDRLLGGAGTDRFDGGTGLDTLEGGGGRDILSGGDGDDRLVGGAGDDLLDGGAGDDFLYGGAGLNELRGGAGNDFLKPADIGSTPGGDGVVNGGDGFDRISYFNEANGVTVDLRILTAQATGRGLHTITDIEYLSGTIFNDVLIGDDRANVLWGSSAGDDRLVGGGGDDLLAIGTGTHLVEGGEGTDTLGWIGTDGLVAGLTVSLAAQGAAQATGQGSATLLSIENLSGTDLDDRLTGDAGVNTLAGAGGSDTLVGGAGDDLLLGDGSISISTGPTGTAGPPITVAAGVGSGADLLDGGAGADRMVGGAGDDRYLVDDVGDRVVEAVDGGIDSVTSSISFDLTGTEVERLALTGTADLSGRGDAGANSLTGNAGANRLTGGAGDDRIDGGAGSDTAVFGGFFRQSAVTPGAAAVTVAGAEGVDMLTGVERIEFADGSFIIDADAAGSQVIRLYAAVLQRAPDNGGLDYYLDVLADRGGTLAGVAGDLIGSAEFQAATGGLGNAQFVDYVYRTTLDRAPDAAGRDFYTRRLDDGLSRAAMLIDFSESVEHRGLTAARTARGYFETDDRYQAIALLYDGAFGRAPDAGGLAYYGDQVKNGVMTVSQVAAEFAGSAEFAGATTGKGNAQIVDLIYRNTLDRAPDAGGLAYYAGLLDQGASVARVFEEIGLSAEHYNLLAGYITYGVEVI